MKKPLEGETYVLEDGYNESRRRIASGGQPEHREATVSKVGTKYFYIGRLKFYIESMQQVSNGIASVKLYDDEQSLLDSRERAKLYGDIRNVLSANSRFGSGAGCSMSLDALRRISAIMAEGCEP